MYGGAGQYDAGGGQYDGNGGAASANNLFGGGGFMPSQTTNTPEGGGGGGFNKVPPPPDPSESDLVNLPLICPPKSYAFVSLGSLCAQGRGSQTLMPLTVKQLMDASQTNDDKSSFAVNGWEVSTVRISHRLSTSRAA
jgi:replication factor A2